MEIYLTVAILWSIAAITPGPNFFITVQTAMSQPLHQSLFTVCGIVTGTGIWAISGYWGVTVLFAAVPVLYYGLKLLGGLYLVYLGARLLLQKNGNRAHRPLHQASSGFNNFRLGVITNLLNPKTAAFITSLFAATIPKSHEPGTGLLSIALICTISALWYSLVAVVFANPMVRNQYLRFRNVIEKVAGGIFIFFGLRLAISK